MKYSILEADATDRPKNHERARERVDSIISLGLEHKFTTYTSACFLCLVLVTHPPYCNIAILSSLWSLYVRIFSSLAGSCLLCVCVCFLPIHSGHQVRWTYQPGSHRISHPPSFCGACLNFSREKDSAIPFPRRPLSRILCTNDLIVLHPLGIFIFFILFNEENPVCRDRTHVPTCQRVNKVPLSYRGDLTVLLLLLNRDQSSALFPPGARQPITNGSQVSFF